MQQGRGDRRPAGQLTEYEVAVGNHVCKARPRRERQRSWKGDAEQVGIDVGAPRQDHPDPAASDRSGPVPVALAERVRPPGGNDDQPSRACCDERAQPTAVVMDQVGVVDGKKRQPPGGEVSSDSGDRLRHRGTRRRQR